MPDSQPFIFVLMPFHHEFDDVERAIKQAARLAHCRVERVDEQKFSDKDIVDKIYADIEAADVIVAVATGVRPNVFYEIGLAHAIRKNVILLIDDAKNIPFDLAHLRSIAPFSANDDACLKRLVEEIEWCIQNPREGERYYREFKKALDEVKANANDLFPFFAPIACKFFEDWINYTKQIEQDGAPMLGPDRLKITRAITFAEKRYEIVERFPEDPYTIHSPAWRNFYDQIGARTDIEKRWTLCLEPEKVMAHKSTIKRAWTFFHERHFTARYLAPQSYTLSSGDPLPDVDVIEYFGRFIKLLKFDGAGYTAGPKPDSLRTTIRQCARADDTMLGVINEISSDIDGAWIEGFQVAT